MHDLSVNLAATSRLMNGQGTNTREVGSTMICESHETRSFEPSGSTFLKIMGIGFMARESGDDLEDPRNFIQPTVLIESMGYGKINTMQ